MARATLLPVLLLLPLILACVDAGGPRVVTEPYVGGATLNGGNTLTGCVAMANAADVCFDVLSGETAATITVQDLSGLPVAGAGKFYDADFAFLGATGTFCGTQSVLVPAGAAFLVVYPQYFVSTVSVCGGTIGQGITHGAKVGFVTASFT